MGRCSSITRTITLGDVPHSVNAGKRLLLAGERFLIGPGERLLLTGTMLGRRSSPPRDLTFDRDFTTQQPCTEMEDLIRL